MGGPDRGRGGKFLIVLEGTGGVDLAAESP